MIIQISMDIKKLPWEEVLGKVDDLIAGLVGLESAGYGKEVSGKKIKYKSYEHGYGINYDSDQKRLYSRGFCTLREWYNDIGKNNNYILFHIIPGCIINNITMRAEDVAIL